MKVLGGLVASRCALLLVIGIAGSQAYAQQGSTVTSGIELGRLFFTPQQRQELDRRRQLNIQEVTAATEDLLTVNGQISRSSGKSTTWVNGVPQDDTFRGKDPTMVTLGGSETETSITVRVGQTIDKTRGAVTDGLAGGEVRKSTPAPTRQSSGQKRP